MLTLYRKIRKESVAKVVNIFHDEICGESDIILSVSVLAPDLLLFAFFYRVAKDMGGFLKFDW